eukprot:gene11361-7867_t
MLLGLRRSRKKKAVVAVKQIGCWCETSVVRIIISLQCARDGNGERIGHQRYEERERERIRSRNEPRFTVMLLFDSLHFFLFILSFEAEATIARDCAYACSHTVTVDSPINQAKENNNNKQVYKNI